VICAGAWTADVLSSSHSGVSLPLTVERAVQLWFTPRQHAERFTPDVMPVFIWEHAPGQSWYGIPSAAHGMKLAVHHSGVYTTAAKVDRAVSSEDVAMVRALVARMMPEANGPLRDSAVCLYTNTPDEHFVIDSPSGMPQVTVVSACSGHGFKFSSAIGELLADRTLDGQRDDIGGPSRRFDISPFRLDRFATARSAANA
jgi:sarcosine oxidase